MRIRNQVLENKYNNSALLSVKVDEDTETNKSGKTTWDVDSFVYQTNIDPQTNAEPLFDTHYPEYDAELVNYEGSDTYTLKRKV